MSDLHTYYAPEVERSLVSLCWHKPELLPSLLRRLDPSVHLTEQYLRDLLAAINACYSEWNATDWPLVIDCLRQRSQLADTEQLLGLDEIFKLAQGYNRAAPVLVDYYVELLSDYAALRDPATIKPPTLRFSGGKGTLTANKTKLKGGCDVLGTAQIAGKGYWIKGWSAADYLGQKCIELRFFPQ